VSSTDSTAALTPDEIHFRKAAGVLVGGMSGAARENAALGRPMLAARGDGARIVGSDGTEYLDFFTGFGATILGHNDPGVRAGIEQALDLGLVHGPETIHQPELARQLIQLVPCAELIRFANSGSEATMAALRAARAHTGRSKILKFEGHFHGLQEHVLYSTHPPAREPAPGELLEPTVDSAGIPSAFADLVAVAPWNDLAAVERAFELHDLAAVIMEPINYNAGCLVADRDYMEAVRDISTRHGTILIYDEILSGFRTGTDCDQGYCGVTPDIALLGKAVANGVPLAVIAGRREVMETFSPLGPTVHSGTYSGHLFGVLAALATLDRLTAPGFYDGPDGVLARENISTAAFATSLPAKASAVAFKVWVRNSVSTSDWIRISRCRSIRRSSATTSPCSTASCAPASTSMCTSTPTISSSAITASVPLTAEPS